MLLRKIAVLAWALVLAGCFNDEPTAPVSISLTPQAPFLTAIGAQVQMQAQASSAVIWASSDAKVASVDSAGLVTAVGEGRATISASADGLSATVEVIVNPQYTYLNTQVRYQDREYDSSGFTGSTPAKPVRYAQMELLDSAGNWLQDANTDFEGKAQFAPVPRGQDYKIRVLATATSPSGTGVSVQNMAGAIYAAATISTVQDETPVALDLNTSNGANGAFAILDTLSAGVQFMAEGAAQAKVPTFRAFWQPGSGYGTYYCTGRISGCPQGAGIYIGNFPSSGDSDEYDDDVIWHEFGHLITHSFSRDDSPGGCHLFSANDLDLRLAWSEGWGDFFPAAIKAWLGQVHPELSSLALGTPTSVYIDTVGLSAGISIDLAAIASTPFVYTSNELAVARVLWRVNQDYGFDALWGVLTGYFPTAAGEASFDTLWDGWLSQNTFSAAQRSAVEAILLERGIDYRADDFEVDDTDYSRMFTQSDGLARTFSGSADVDRVKLSATSGVVYQIATSNLRNGADTRLRVMDANGTVLAENDDYNTNYLRYDSQCGSWRVFNDGTSLASKIEFTAPATTDYYIETRPAQEMAYDSASARYGGYTLTTTPK